MARTADHDARRAQIIGGVKRITLDAGLGQVTISGVARTAGVSVGLVQHYYASKQDLLLDTFRSVRHDVLARIDAAVVRAERRQARIEQMMLDGLQQFLPLNRQRTDEAHLMHAFAGLAFEDPSLQPGLREAQAEHLKRVETALQNGKLCGEVETATDARAEAYALLALTDGLAVRLLTDAGRSQRAWARRALTREVARLCPGECRHHAAR